MILIYDKNTRNVLMDGGTNSLFPLGVEDVSWLINEVISLTEKPENELGVYRIHDETDLDKIEQYRKFESKVIIDDTGEPIGLEFLNERPQLETEPKPPTLEEKIEALEQEKLILQLALAESIEKQEIDKVNNQLALAELVETLTMKGVL
ncbi:hypothetical protein [Cytobacillus solani]|uniref:Uncharacterized protein n=1 Tax=Cytobacillus solani TaxID=1637975 RepID=A0A0Q3SFN2_9BACI|nr:hypothetical protein [Cytobacillus solani]KQL18076.1 hypothetical protein AN957_05240 [Cytobacillus solani]